MNCFSLISLIVACGAAVQAMPNAERYVAQMSVRKDSQASFSPYLEEFKQFQQVHGKKYDSLDEEFLRYSIFVDKVQKIKEHNVKYAKGETSYYMAVNQFSDMTHDEFLKYNRLGRYSKMVGKKSLNQCASQKTTGSAPETMDWRDKGAVTPVKNQGQCGSCWTFSTTGSIEGQNAINTGNLLSFSEQQIVDCCHAGECQGCDGGLMDDAFEYINKTGGLELESVYPYEATDDSCKFDRSKIRVKVVGCTDVTQDDESALKNAVGTVGPVSVAIDASHESFQSYSGGVYDEQECSSEQLDHGVLAVGYGSQDGADYWLVKNSWGTGWGMEGYIMMSRNRDNQCGIASSASYPATAAPAIEDFADFLLGLSNVG